MLAIVAAVRDPFEQSFFIMAHLPYLQPFDDENKRCSRLAANIPLVQRNLCPLSFVDVDREMYTAGVLGVYELGRMDLLHDVFVWAYQRSCSRYAAIRQSLGQPDPFRLRYRELIGVFVQEVVGKNMGKADASNWIGQVSCLVDNVKAQDMKFYGGKKAKPLGFKAAAGTTQVSLSWD